MSYHSPDVNELDTSLEDVSEYVPPDTSLNGDGDTCTDGTSTIKEKKDAVVAEVIDGLIEKVVDEVLEEDISKSMMSGKFLNKGIPMGNIMQLLRMTLDVKHKQQQQHLKPQKIPLL